MASNEGKRVFGGGVGGVFGGGRGGGVWGGGGVGFFWGGGGGGGGVGGGGVFWPGGGGGGVGGGGVVRNQRERTFREIAAQRESANGSDERRKEDGPIKEPWDRKKKEGTCDRDGKILLEGERKESQTASVLRSNCMAANKKKKNSETRIFPGNR